MIPCFYEEGTATFTGGPANLPNKTPRNPPNWIILGSGALLSCVSIDILLVKAILFLVFCLVVRNNLCGSSSS